MAERDVRSMQQDAVDTIRTVRTGVVNLILERGRERVGSGTGFLIPDHVVTASHVLREGTFDVAMLRFDDSDEEDVVRLSAKDLMAAVRHESPKSQCDYALLAIDEPEFRGRHRFTLAATPKPSVGQQVLLLGYPFASPNLASHVAYVSALYRSGDADVFQLDGSINPSNSGGPVIDPESSEVLAYVVRAQTGLMQDFDVLIENLTANVEVLSQPRTSMSIGGVDPVRALRATMAAMRQLALNMKRSANVGIGYAHSARHITDALRSY